MTVNVSLALCCSDEGLTTAKSLRPAGASAVLTGCPGYDMLAEIVKAGIPKNDTALLVVHPEAEQSSAEQLAFDVAVAVQHAGLDIYGWWPNHDPGNRRIVKMARQAQHRGLDRWYKDLSRPVFLRMLSQARLIIGNSSAGIREAGACGTWTIDIGSRQSGRGPIGAHVARCVDGAEPEEIAEKAIRLARHDPPDPWWGFGLSDGENAHRCAESIDTFLRGR